MLKTVDLCKDFESPTGTLSILRGVQLEIKKGELVFIFGRSGAGKSTLLHLLSGLDQPSSGTIKFNGRDIGKLSEEALAEYRNKKIGFVFQFYHLLPELTVRENVELPSLIAGKRRLKHTEGLLKEVGLWERRDHMPSELSGGELQRAAIARSLVNSPELIFCDEPTGNLDETTAASVRELIFDLHRGGHTFCVVTHEESFARKTDRALRLHEGVLQEA